MRSYPGELPDSTGNDRSRRDACLSGRSIVPILPLTPPQLRTPPAAPLLPHRSLKSRRPTPCILEWYSVCCRCAFRRSPSSSPIRAWARRQHEFFNAILMRTTLRELDILDPCLWTRARFPTVSGSLALSASYRKPRELPRFRTALHVRHVEHVERRYATITPQWYGAVNCDLAGMLA